MDYADSVQKVLLRKINKAEQDLMQLKLDYCRFIFGLTHRSQVIVGETHYSVHSVDLDSMTRQEDGSLNRPVVWGVPEGAHPDIAPLNLGTEWRVAKGAAGQAGS
ncbi:hypothetical protein EZI54_19520 [Marinobacter halodurans]|uniref:Uncharacterized protein n=1 Tax=Marinobacter halodurans TaxID=2528979 RepID=A0ABY1ZFA5_9GAMM|nr:hypothetical protein [Marinobacter halodurans]TBW49510.1 hypothetical protein EZI54_19520 [Marinobacter halodurans]